VEYKRRCVNFRTALASRRGFLPAYRVTGIVDYRYRSIMEKIVTGLEKPQSAGENSGFTWDHLAAQAVWLEAPTTTLGALTTSLGPLVTSMCAP